MIISHKGGPVWGPPNSKKVFKASIENNVEAVEADICLSKDGVLVIHHGTDELSVRKVREMTVEEL